MPSKQHLSPPVLFPETERTHHYHIPLPTTNVVAAPIAGKGGIHAHGPKSLGLIAGRTAPCTRSEALHPRP